MDWGNMFGAFGMPGMGGQPTTSPTQPQAPPEERFREQLQQLQEMGFTDQQANIAALLATNGFVQGAIERLLNS
jgi:ubiquilin